MTFTCKLVKKAFTTKEGVSQDYYVFQFDLADGSTLDVPLKSDKSKRIYNLIYFQKGYKT